MNPFIIWKRIFWAYTLVAHLGLLAWILWVLQVSGGWEMEKIFWHFLGLSSYGALLILVTAKVTKYFHLQEWKREHAKKRH